jgi:hypothetical protein
MIHSEAGELHHLLVVIEKKLASAARLREGGPPFFA